MTTDRSSYTAGLRALANLLDEHPDVLPLPFEGTTSPISFAFHGYEHDGRNAEAMADAARLLISGTRSKGADDHYYRLTGNLHGLRIETWAMREQVCERVVTGTRVITRDVPDAEALAAVPTTTVTETVEDVEWVCQPLLAEQVPA